jgi:hypothetical protein
MAVGKAPKNPIKLALFSANQFGIPRDQKIIRRLP